MPNWNYKSLKEILERAINTDWELLKARLQYDEVLEGFINEIEKSQRRFMASVAGKASAKKRDMSKLGKRGAKKRWETVRGLVKEIEDLQEGRVTAHADGSISQTKGGKE